MSKEVRLKQFFTTPTFRLAAIHLAIIYAAERRVQCGVLSHVRPAIFATVFASGHAEHAIESAR